MIMSKLKITVVSFAVMLGLGSLLVASPAFAAVDVWGECNGVTTPSAVCASKGNEVGTMIRSVVSVMLVILGAIAVIMIIIGGILYTLSAGDPGKTKKAKDTILYSVIGLVVALLAYGIVEFVVKGVS